jgi:phosphoribosyl 1,2-cyclic phosphate phosphodiesterase
MANLSIEILGSGGAIRTPRPGCQCECCRQARRYGAPWARTGPSVFVQGPDVLIDTPEDACAQVDRAGIGAIAAGLYSHWHPDHTAGRRMWETRNADFRNWPAQPVCTPIYLPSHVWRDFERMEIMSAFRYMERAGWVKLHMMDAPLELGGWRITAHAVAESYVYAFLFEELDGARRVLVAMDELFGWEPPAHLCNLDLAILPKGLFDVHPFTGKRMIPAEHPVLASEATYAQTLVMAEQLAARRIVFMHLEEVEQVTPTEYTALACDLRAKRGWDVTFAHDGVMIQL